MLAMSHGFLTISVLALSGLVGEGRLRFFWIQDSERQIASWHGLGLLLIILAGLC